MAGAEVGDARRGIGVARLGVVGGTRRCAVERAGLADELFELADGAVISRVAGGELAHGGGNSGDEAPGRMVGDPVRMEDASVCMLDGFISRDAAPVCMRAASVCMRARRVCKRRGGILLAGRAGSENAGGKAWFYRVASGSARGQSMGRVGVDDGRRGKC